LSPHDPKLLPNCLPIASGVITLYQEALGQIHTRMVEAKNPTRQSPVPTPPNKYDQLTKLGELKASGVLTDEEFAQEKAKILST
jgi:Short C-terminal domain